MRNVITRFAFFSFIVAVFALTLRDPTNQLGDSAKAQVLVTQPNIIYIFTDDQPWFTLCGLEDAPPDLCELPVTEHPMPVVEQRLMGEGTVFTRAFATTPFCCPARANFLSGGFFSHHTNVLTNAAPNGGAARFVDKNTLPTLLQMNGYKTALIGKYMNGYEKLFRSGAAPYIPPGWDLFVATYRITDPNSYYEFATGSSTSSASTTGTITVVNDGTNVTDYERDRALAFIEEHCDFQSCTAPFFLFLSTDVPHSPAMPSPRNAQLFPNFVYRGRGWNEQPDGDISDKPAYVKTLAGNTNPSIYDEVQRNQLRTLRDVDEAISAIIAELEAKDILDNTIIIYSTDNGIMWGMHKLTAKDKPYEEAIRLPLIMRGPGVAAQTVDQLVAVDLDVAPTILELAGIAPTATDGMSLLPLIANPQSSWRTELLIQGGYQNEGVPTWVGIRTADWKYVEYVTGERELYHLTAGDDPFELQSKHNDPAHDATEASLAAQLAGLDQGLVITKDYFPNPQISALATGTTNTPYSFQFQARGGNGTYTWKTVTTGTLCNGSLPPGLLLQSDGLFTGTPTQSGSWNFCVQVSDSSTSPQPANSRTQIHILPVSISVTDVPTTGTLEGVVTDASTNAPIASATVTINGQSSTTDASGFYEFIDLAEGTYDVTASATNYMSSTVTAITIAAGTVTSQNFALTLNCTTNCLRSTITLRISTDIRANVTIRDENGTVVSNANVFATWTLPDGTTENQQRKTNTNGLATIRTADRGPGTYTITITNVTKTGYIFDRGPSTLTASIVKQ